MKIIVTGCAGFIGSHIVDECINRGWTVHGIDNLTTGRKENINPKCDFIDADIREFDYASLGKVDGVFHTAALARIQPSFQKPLEYQSVNVTGTLRIIQYAINYGAKIVFSSSSSVYGVKGKLSAPIDEKYPLNPCSPYAYQKLFCENYLDLFHDTYGLKYMALRYFNVYGERQIPNGAYAAVIGIFLDKHKKGEPFPIYGDGMQKRDFTYVKDVVDANIRAFLCDKEEGVYNIGSGGNHSIIDIANYIDYTHPIDHLPERIGEAQETLADFRHAWTAFGWQPKTKIKDWINAVPRT